MDAERYTLERQPLLSPSTASSKPTYKSISLQSWLYPHNHSVFASSREAVRHRLSSKNWHYLIIGLVCLDVFAMLASFVIELFKCQNQWGDKGWSEALEACEIIGLVFSSLFVAELLASIWAFGFSYFKSSWHTFDALVVIAGFTLDVLLHGVVEEAASLIIVLRLWRVFEIIEELVQGAKEDFADLNETIEKLEGDNEKLRNELESEGAGRGEMEELKREIGELRRRISGGEGSGRRVERCETPPTPD